MVKLTLLNPEVQITEGQMPTADGTSVAIRSLIFIDQSGLVVDVPMAAEEAKGLGKALVGSDLVITNQMPPSPAI